MKRVAVVLLSICLALSFTGCVMEYPKPEEPPVYFTRTLDNFIKGHRWYFINMVTIGMEDRDSAYAKRDRELVKEAFQEKDIGDGCTMWSARWDCCSMTIFCKGEKIYRVDVEGNPYGRSYNVASERIYQRDINCHLYALAAGLLEKNPKEIPGMENIALDWMDEELTVGEVREEAASGIRLRVERVNEKREIITVTPLAE